MYRWKGKKSIWMRKNKDIICIYSKTDLEHKEENWALVEQSTWNTGWGKSRFIIVNMQNTELILLFVLNNYCVVFHMSNCKFTFAQPCIYLLIWYISVWILIKHIFFSIRISLPFFMIFPLLIHIYPFKYWLDHRDYLHS